MQRGWCSCNTRRSGHRHTRRADPVGTQGEEGCPPQDAKGGPRGQQPTRGPRPPCPQNRREHISRGVSPSPRCLVTAARADSRGTDQAQPQQPLAGAVVSAAARAETRGPLGFLRPLYSSRIDRSSTSWQTLDRAVGTRRRSDSCTRSLCLSAVGAIHTGRVCQRREWSDRFCLGNEGEATNERPVREDDALALRPWANYSVSFPLSFK